MRQVTGEMCVEMSDERHAEKMRRKQAAHEKIMADKTREKGLLIVHTGKGKGKTTAALGMVVRAIGHGMKVGIVQFVKGAMTTWRPMRQLWPMCTMLSNLVPSPMEVTPSAARSTQELAPISTRSPRCTRPRWRRTTRSMPSSPRTSVPRA